MAPVGVGADVLGGDAQMVSYVQEGGSLNGGNAVLPAGLPAVHNARPIEVDLIVQLHDPAYLFTFADLSLLALILEKTTFTPIPSTS